MNDMAELYSHATSFYNVSNNDKIGLTVAVIGLFILFIGFISASYSCGGRDSCRKKWCIIGILQENYYILWTTGMGFLAAGLLWTAGVK